jgi:phage shock protein PspC (stress-responsive transcriptional regulator)
MDKIFDFLRNLGFERGPKRLVGGIGGGLARKLDVNVWVIRFLLLLSFLLPFVGIGLYLVVWILTPWQDGRIPLERMFSSGR